MQLMPVVATEYGVEDPFEPAQSISAGARYMKALLRRYHGDRTLAAAAYNAGIGTVARYGGVPPYDETQAYIDKVLTLYRSEEHTSELQSLMRISYAVFCLKNNTTQPKPNKTQVTQH